MFTVLSDPGNEMILALKHLLMLSTEGQFLLTINVLGLIHYLFLEILISMNSKSTIWVFLST